MNKGAHNLHTDIHPGAAGDPAALGVSAILIGQTAPAYLDAAGRQMDHLLTAVPRWPNGAISHREAVAELWADFLYMAPPALAYWAVAKADAGLLAEVLGQCSLYRDVLGVPHVGGGGSGNSSGGVVGDPMKAGGLWHHIIGPETQDLGIWSTGNAWAAAGMARVLATALKFPNNSNKTSEKQKKVDTGIQAVKAIVRDILDAAIALDDAEPAEPLLRNYLNDTSWFGELSGTTLLTATVYRLAVLAPDDFGHGSNGSSKYVKWADAKRPEIISRIDDQGLLSPVINPLDWGDRTPGTESPEAQSFAVLMFAAWRDYQEAGRNRKGKGKKASGGAKIRRSRSSA